MYNLRFIRNNLRFIYISAIIYFCFDYFVQRTNFLQCYSFVGLKSFLPMTIGLNFGLYGIIGELIAVSLTSYLLHTAFKFYIMEIIIVLIFGLGSWFLWHMQSYTHRIHFRYLFNFVRYISLSVFLSFICAIIANNAINRFAYEEVLVWNISMDILVGIPVNIIYAGLMNLNPILPPIYVRGEKIKEKNDIIFTVDGDIQSFQTLSEMVEGVLMREKVDMKKTFIIQNLIEEMYLRITRKFPKAIIDVKANCDVDFSVEFIFIEKKFNPFIVQKDEEESDVAGLKIIKHRALLAFYSYIYGENRIHIVI